MVAEYEVPCYLIDENIVTYMLQFWDVMPASHDSMRGEWRYNIMIDQKTFYSIPDTFDLEDCLLLWQEGNQPVGIMERLVMSLQTDRGKKLLRKRPTIYGISSLLPWRKIKKRLS